MTEQAVNLLLPLPLADQLANYIVSNPSPNLPVSQAYGLIEALKKLEQAPEGDAPGDAAPPADGADE